MNIKQKRERAVEILTKMEEIFPPGAKSELTEWETPFQFLICVIVSPQTTDKLINKVVPGLWEHYPDVESLANADISHVEELIHSLNFYRNKSKYIVGTSKMILEEFEGEIPKTEKDLIKFPGVGKKVANVFLNDMYEANIGIGVDTHIMRISHRLGLTEQTNPDKVAGDLQGLFDQDDWSKVNSLFVLYGRYYCKARVKPEDSECVFDFCSHCRK